MRTLSRLALPFVRLLTLSTNLVLRLIGVKPSSEPPITEEEIGVLLEQGAEAGVFDQAEQEMVEAVFRLGDRRVGTIMTNRLQIVWLDLEDTLEETYQRVLNSQFSRFPVGQGSLDAVVGIVQAKDMLKRILADGPLDLREVMEPPQFVPESMPVRTVLELFRESRVHIALVFDEYGGLQGLVTLNNIIEAIVGDIPEFGMAAEPEAIQREDGSWLMDGRIEVEELKELLGLRQLPDEERGYFHTLGGFVMTFLGRLPHTGDEFTWDHLRFEVMDMDGFRVDKVLVKPLD
jgi:putative hemolysin